ncbi:hypothetical protein R1sor_013120 [Riccia sorocarpa]|uniref:Reverse transcriptase zinc-binding domain-containing protein n=1 Tax=Riccia sorocarpa TaxID=122646 RepID=A0ABD3H7H7_9MARC
MVRYVEKKEKKGKGFFTGAKAIIMKVSTDNCKRCNVEIESISHLFWICREVKRGWQELRRLAFETAASFRIQETFLQTIDEALLNKRKGGTLTAIMAAACQQIWSDCNAQVFQNLRKRTPLLTILKVAQSEIGAALSPNASITTWEKKLKQLEELRSLLDIANRAPATTSSGRASVDTSLTIRIATPAPYLEEVLEEPNTRPPPIGILLTSLSLTQPPDNGADQHETV